jgi:hypothetical protein
MAASNDSRRHSMKLHPSMAAAAGIVAAGLTNRGSSACTLQGFPGVDLDGVANGQQNYTWPLDRQSVSYAAVTLRPGETGHFSLIYLPGNSASSDITVTKLVITPPTTTPRPR